MVLKDLKVTKETREPRANLVCKVIPDCREALVTRSLYTIDKQR